MDKKWYQSKKFIAAIATIVAIVLQRYLGIDMDTDQLALLVGAFISYLLVETGLDVSRAKGSYHPLQDPAVRTALEALIAETYDFAAAQKSGLDAYVKEVTEKVITGLENIGVPKSVLQGSEELTKEITRILVKMYQEDQKMKEGADLVAKASK